MLGTDTVTDPEAVRRFLDGANGLPQVVFSTYSSPVIKEAMRDGEALDLAIFDEAHRTAGRVGRNFSMALDNSQTAIKKRVFFTATPRHCRVRPGGEQIELYSMDDPKVYGRQAFKLSAKEAIEKDITCSYKVLITAVTSDKVNDWLLSHAQVNRLGDPVLARQVANQLALAEAMQAHGIKATFSFHSSIEKHGQGILAFNINPAGAIAGNYLDASNVFHGCR